MVRVASEEETEVGSVASAIGTVPRRSVAVSPAI